MCIRDSGYVEPEYVQAMLDREKLTPTYLGESIAVPHGTVAVSYTHLLWRFGASKTFAAKQVFDQFD